MASPPPGTAPVVMRPHPAGQRKGNPADRPAPHPPRAEYPPRLLRRPARRAASARTAGPPPRERADLIPPRPERANAVFSRFFIDRPIFATVLSILITLAGAIALWALP